MPRSLVRRLIDRCVAALFAVWVVAAGQIAKAEVRPEGPAYAVVRHDAPGALCLDETQLLQVVLENTGGRTWAPEDRDRLSYHWRDAQGRTVVRDGRRTELEGEVAPGEQVTLDAKVTAPAEAGRYTLVWRMLREGDGWFPEDPDGAAAVTVRGEGAPLAWSVLPFEMPDLAAQAETTVSVTVVNEGCSTWSDETADRLSYRWFSPDGTRKLGEGPRTGYGQDVGPGERVTVPLKVRGPKRPGKAILRIAPVRERVAWLGEPVRGDADTVVQARDAALQWSWLDARLPADVGAGDVFEVEVEVRNDGVEAWDPAEGDRLSYHWQREGLRTGREGRRTLLPHRVEPGETLRLTVKVVAPDTPGPAALALEPLRERVAWFGPPVRSSVGEAPTLEIQPPPFVWSLLGVRTPKVPLAGRTTEFLLSVRNDGSRAWEPSLKDRASYEILSPDGTRVARGRRTALPRRIEPGEVVQIPVSFDTPRKPGEYQVAFGIVREHVRWFETDATPVRIRVMRRSSLWVLGAGVLLVLWGSAARRRHGWALVVAWPLWVSLCAAVLTELFADLAQFQVFASGTPVALSVAAGLGALVAAVSPRWRGRVAIALVGLLSLVAWVDLAYAAFFGSLAPLTAVAAVHHLADAQATVSSTISIDHAWLVVPLGSAFWVWWCVRGAQVPARPRGWRVVGVFALLGAYAAVALGIAVHGSLGLRIFSEARNAQRFGYVGAHLFQALRLVRDLGAPPLSEAERTETFARLRATRAAAPTEHRGIAQGANLVILQVEALQQWAVHAEVDGVPVMPFLSGAHEQALAYDHIYDQTLQGRTSDAEYLVLASGHALPEGALSFLRADNRFRTLVHALTERGYTSYSAHPYERGFWNRSVLHPAYGFADSDFKDELGRGPKSGWGLADGPFLERFDQRLAGLPEPFVAFGITLSLHHPYGSFPKSLAELEVGELEGTWVANYLQAMRHFDRSLQAWLETMEARGQLEHTVVLVYGDHVTGMDLDDDVAALAGVSDDRYAQIRMHRVPAFLWVPGGSLHGRRSMVGGQIDLGVTAMHMLGVDPPAAAVGTPLVGEGPGFVALPTGGAVAPGHMLVRRGVATPTGGACIDPEQPGGHPRDACDGLEQRALDQLELARRVLDHDLYQAAEDVR